MTVVERKIRVIKERVRAIINTVPFSLSELLESWLLTYVVNRLNLVPTRNSVAYVSPREKLYGRKINVDKELKHGFGDYVQVHNQRKSIITSSMFLKDKYSADGKFDKLKFRLVAGGHLQDRNIYDNGSSPTVSTTSVFIVAAIAAGENRAVATIDFPGAFLNSDMPLDGEHAVLMRLNIYFSNILVSINKSYQKYVNEIGTVVVKLKKALYGCVESAKLWYDKISSDLTQLGYEVSKSIRYMRIQ